MKGPSSRCCHCEAGGSLVPTSRRETPEEDCGEVGIIVGEGSNYEGEGGQ
jgi:hypothetical protein